MPEPLVCEDTSLTRLMDTVNETAGARILYQDTVRRGGILGFFAREVHRIAYVTPGTTVALGELDPAGVEQQPYPGAVLPPAGSQPLVVSSALSFGHGSDEPSGTEFGAFAALLAEADAEETNVNVGQHRHPEEADFASILRRYAAETEPVGEHAAELSAGLQATVAISTAAEPRPGGLAEVTPIHGGGAQARDRLELLMQLRQVGVPVTVNPGAEVQGLYQALEEILDQLPEPVALPSRPGVLLAIVGEAGPALRAARATAKLLRLPGEEIVVAGMDEDAAPELRRVNGRRQAARLRQEVSEWDLPGIVVVATDGGSPDDTTLQWANDLLDALRPDQSWAVIDARWKLEDCHSRLDRLSPVQGLVVYAAELSTSPATVWDLDLPLALLDERRPSTFVWLSLLLRLLGPSQQRHRASA